LETPDIKAAEEQKVDPKTNEKRVENIGRMLEELHELNKKKQELIERNNRLKENQQRPARDYSNNRVPGKQSAEKSLRDTQT
jgi:hypothetical protein